MYTIVAGALLVLALTACGSEGEGVPTQAVESGSDEEGPLPSAPPGTDQPSSEVEATLRIGSASAGMGNEVTVSLTASGMTAPGLGAWAIKVVYDPSVLSVMECPTVGTGVCNPTFDQRTVLFAGATGGGPGLTGDATLGSITFRCESAGTSALAISVQVLADATTNSPWDMQPTVEDGEIVCG
jgi:hypothetical protein